jgi:cell division septation protein DedD
MLVLVLVLALAAALTPGCAKRQPPVRSPADLPTTMPSEEEAARALPGAPEAIPAPVQPATQTPPAIQTPPGIMEIKYFEPSVTAGPPTAPIDSLAEATPADARPGFRVQLFATADASLAQTRADEYRSLFTEPIHIRKEDELYKIQAGDCETREAADGLRRKARALGYAGAFVVEARIAVR